MNSSIEKEIQIKLVDQLHNAVSQISNFCFEIKKFSITTLFIVLTFTIAFTKNRLDISIFIITYIITFCFWFLDATAYFYQVKLRAKIDEKLNKIRSLNPEQPEQPEQDTIEDSRVNKRFFYRLKDAALNHSMWIYYILIILNSLAFILFINDIIS